jgi:hypothetical protein
MSHKLTKKTAQKSSQSKNIKSKSYLTYAWEKLSDKELLELRFCDLELKIEGSRIEPLVHELYKELEKKKIKFKPHLWISEDWFAIDGIPGIAVPFYTLHKRLSGLCKKMNLEDEGYNKKEAIKLLRHETGHAIDNAYKLRLLRSRQSLFGLSSTSYPDTYAPVHLASSYVSHLNPWYAQAHPDEDWAETFATWLTPNSKWKEIYKNTTAYEKLIFIDKVMKSIEGKEPLVIKKNQPGDISNSRRKLKTFFLEKIESLQATTALNMLPSANYIFSSLVKYRSKKRADVFLKENKDLICKKIAQWTGHNSFTVRSIYSELISSCSELNLHLIKSERETRLDLTCMLTSQIINSTVFNSNKIIM